MPRGTAGCQLHRRCSLGPVSGVASPTPHLRDTLLTQGARLTTSDPQLTKPLSKLCAFLEIILTDQSVFVGGEGGLQSKMNLCTLPSGRCFLLSRGWEAGEAAGRWTSRTKSNCSRTSRCHGIGVRPAGRLAAKDGNVVLSWGAGAAYSLSFPCVWKVPVGRAALPPRPALVLARVGQAFSPRDAWSPGRATPNPSAPGRGPTRLHQARAT